MLNAIIRHANWGNLNSAGRTSTGYRLDGPGLEFRQEQEK